MIRALVYLVTGILLAITVRALRHEFGGNE